jgi:hypothetical protein
MAEEAAASSIGQRRIDATAFIRIEFRAACDAGREASTIRQ